VAVTSSREVVDGQHQNIEDSSVPWKVRETGVSRCGSTMWAEGKLLLRHHAVGPKKRAPVPRHAGFDRGR
jgi:hypothetical protein